MQCRSSLDKRSLCTIFSSYIPNIAMIPDASNTLEKITNRTVSDSYRPDIQYQILQTYLEVMLVIL